MILLQRLANLVRLRSPARLAALIALGTPAAFGQLPTSDGSTAPTPPDKSRYTLFNPAPRPLMRDLSTDRPDQTESPFTVDAGHWQVEMDFAVFTSDDDDGVRSESLNLAPVNIKLGLTNRVDLQLVLDNHSTERVRSSGLPRTKTRDWGDATFRLKVNLWGNDDTSPGATAAALMPFVKVPLKVGDAGNDLYEGGIMLPVAISLPGDVNLGLMTEIDWLADDAGRTRNVQWLNTATVSRALVGALGGYLEGVAVFNNEDGTPWVGQVDVGLTYAVSADIQLDAGCNFGVTRSAPDFEPFAGIAVRF